MPGYQLIQDKYLSPPLPAGKGVKANNRRIGFLDFLKELGDEHFPYHDESSLCVVGLEDVLLFSRPDMTAMAHTIHQKLQRAARHFEKNNCPWVQIVFRSELVRGETLRVNHPAAELPIYLIFGSPPPEHSGEHVVCYRCSFNLSSI